MTWRILIEEPPGIFKATGEMFTGTRAEAEAYVEQLRVETGICHAAELSA